MIYRIQMTNLKVTLMFLTKTDSELMMKIIEFCLRKTYAIVYNWILVSLMIHHQNLILQLYHIKSDRQKNNRSTIFLEFLIFPTLTLFKFLLRNSLGNQIHLCLSINHEPPTETLEPNMICDNYREKDYCLFIP